MVHGKKMGTFPFWDKKICMILLLISLTYCVQAVHFMKVTSEYQNGTMMISVDIQNKTDLSNSILYCILYSQFNPDIGKLFFNLQNEQQGECDPQFKNRVQYRYDNLTGQVKIELLRFGAEDVGNVMCEYIDRTRVKGNCTLNLPKPTSGPVTTKGATPSSEDQKTVLQWILVAAGVVVGVVVVVGAGVRVGVVVKKCRRQQGRGQGQNGDALELQNMNPDEVVSLSQMENGGHPV